MLVLATPDLSTGEIKRFLSSEKAMNLCKKGETSQSDGHRPKWSIANNRKSLILSFVWQFRENSQFPRTNTKTLGYHEDKILKRFYRGMAARKLIVKSAILSQIIKKRPPSEKGSESDE
jgi:hypothetical protein